MVEKSGIQVGDILVCYPHTTGAVALIEHEAGIIMDPDGNTRTVVVQEMEE
jgi:thiamine phosphate synthase YjbQ (UPF0047 family)